MIREWDREFYTFVVSSHNVSVIFDSIVLLRITPSKMSTSIPSSQNK